MVKRRQVRRLRRLCLEAVEDLASHLCLHVARSVLPPPNQDIFQDADNTQTRVQVFLETLASYVWGQVVHYQQQEVADHFLEGTVQLTCF